jgi:hypothetical protein
LIAEKGDFMSVSEEMIERILAYKKWTDADKLKWLNDCLEFNYAAFSEEERKKRVEIKNILYKTSP